MKGIRYQLGTFFIFLITISLASCSSSRNRKFEKNVSQVLDLHGFQDHFTGIMVYASESEDTLLAINHKKHFTPASNTKIFTLYSALKILGDSVPSLKYIIKGDTLFFEGTGYPANLHPHFQDSTLVDFLDQYETLVYTPGNFSEGRFGPGWAWEDYESRFSAERSAFPLYGNVITIYKDLNVVPEYFRDSIRPLANARARSEESNTFFIQPSQKDSLEIPFKTGSQLTVGLLEQALGKPVILGDSMPEGEKMILYGSTPPDSLYKRLMQESDNFIAEQLLILSSSVLTDTLSFKLSRDFVLDTYLKEMEDTPRWVDGSGLSRYNLFTPASMVYVLNKLHGEIDRDRLFHIFPSGGKNGTLEEWYGGKVAPYVFAKSGTLGNTYCLSGYLISKSGKLLIFSFMNNHFMEPGSQVKLKIQKVLETIRDSY